MGFAFCLSGLADEYTYALYTYREDILLHAVEELGNARF